MLTNQLNLPQPFVEAARSNHAYKPNRYSVTELLGGTCEAVLKRRHAEEASEDVSDRVWAILGTAVHKVFEEAQDGSHGLSEHWQCVSVGDYELSGIMDLYEPETGTVTDWKTCSVWKVQVGTFDDWRQQVLLYSWMLRQRGERVDRGRVVAIMRDHSKRDARLKPSYPQHPVMVVEWEFTEEDFELAGRHVTEWYESVRRQEARADAELEPCSPEQCWHKDEKWAVMRKGRKKALRLLATEDEALAYIEALGDGDGCYVERRAGEDTRCESYCSMAPWCPHGRKFQKS